MPQFGMPTLIENKTLEDNISLCRSLGLRFIELNMNFPEYQTDRLEPADSLLSAAEQAGVTLRLESEEVTAWTVPHILEDILYNLCDNAVAYNRPGGRVTVTVVQGFDAPRIEVSDTGIGIPESARERIFERFYRLDESHSGRGTGLGLSIVKHGAARLGIQISLESQVGVGSTFTLTFPEEMK